MINQQPQQGSLRDNNFRGDIERAVVQAISEDVGSGDGSAKKCSRTHASLRANHALCAVAPGSMKCSVNSILESVFNGTSATATTSPPGPQSATCADQPGRF
jgi:hypothetical protein